MIAISFCVHLLHRYKAKIIGTRTFNKKGIQNNLLLCSKKFWHDEIFIFLLTIFNAIIFDILKECPKDTLSFHEVQCQEFNYIPYQNGLYEWQHVPTPRRSYITRLTPRLSVFDFTNIISKAFNRWGQFKPDKKSYQMHFLYQVVPSF